MDTIMDNTGIYCGMELYSSDLGTGKLAFHPNIVDMIVFDQAESGPHTSTDTGLFAMGYLIVTNNMRTDVFFIPTIPDRIESYFDIMQRTVETRIVQPDVMTGLTLFSQRYT